MSKRREQTNTVAAAEAAVVQLEQKIERHRERAAELAAARKASSYAAHVLFDAEQGKVLSDIVDETVRHETEGRALIDALDECKRRLEQARQDAASSADRAAALALRKSFAEFVALAEALDAALATVVEISAAMGVKVNDIHGCGSAAPTGQQWLSAGERAIGTALMLTPWRRAFAHLPPNERHTFSEISKGWQGGAERNIIAARLGESKESEDAAA